MSGHANPLRGEAAIRITGELRTLRPSFTALVAAEEELGPLFALVERAGNGELRLAEIAALFWHCLESRGGLTRAFTARVLFGVLPIEGYSSIWSEQRSHKP